jgi:lysophospholipase L1-like esterase
MKLRPLPTALLLLSLSAGLALHAVETDPATTQTSKTKRAPAAKPPKSKKRSTKSSSHAARKTVHTSHVSLNTREIITDRINHSLASTRVGIENPRALRPFFSQLHQLEADPHGQLVRVIQFGDSHTAADMFTGALRTLFQDKFGNGGAGFQYAGYPFAGYRIHGTSRAQSTGWLALGTHLRDIGDGLVGMGGVSLSTEAAGNWVTLDADATSFEVQYLIQPDGGTIEIRDNDQLLATISTATGQTLIPATTTEPTTSGKKASLSADSTQTDTTDAVAIDSDQTQDQTLQAQTKAQTQIKIQTQIQTQTLQAQTVDSSASPLLAGQVSAGHYTTTLPPGHHHIEVLTTEAAPVRLLGLSTENAAGVTYEAAGINGAEASLFLRWNETIQQALMAETNPALIVLAYGTNEAGDRNWTEETYASLLRRIIERCRRLAPNASILVIGPPDRALRNGRHGWAAFTGVDRIVQAQRAVCRQMNCAYWDQRSRMGGFGSMRDWVAISWAQPDHTHFTGEGYNELASALFSDIVQQYDAYPPPLVRAQSETK